MVFVWALHLILSVQTSIWLYEQIDGVCMGSSLGPVLANIIMTELEKIVLPKLCEEEMIKFYVRYVDGTHICIPRTVLKSSVLRIKF